MIFSWLDNIRSKPKAVRERYAFIFSTFLIVIIVAVWSLSLPTRFSNLAFSEEVDQEASVPFSGIWQNLKAQLPTRQNQAPSSATASAQALNPIEVVVEQAQTGNLPDAPAVPPVGNIVQIGTSSPVNNASSSNVD